MLQCVRSCVLRPADPSMAGGIHPPQLDYGRGNYGMLKTVSETSLFSVSSVSDEYLTSSVPCLHSLVPCLDS